MSDTEYLQFTDFGWYGITSTLQNYALTHSLIFVGNLFVRKYASVHSLLIAGNQKMIGFPFHYFRSLWKYFPIVHIPLSL